MIGPNLSEWAINKRSLVIYFMIVALIAIVAAAIFGFTLGTFFSVAMVGLAGAAVLYDTSNVLHHFQEDSYVAASLELFASIALMFILPVPNV